MPHTLFSLAPQVPPERALPDPPLLRLEAEASQAYLSVLLHVQAAASEPVKAACSLEARLTQLCLRNLERFEQQELEAGESGDEDGETPPPSRTTPKPLSLAHAHSVLAAQRLHCHLLFMRPAMQRARTTTVSFRACPAWFAERGGGAAVSPSAARHREENAALAPLAVATLRALLLFSPEAFRSHLKDFFPLLTALISCEYAPPEVQVGGAGRGWLWGWAAGRPRHGLWPRACQPGVVCAWRECSAGPSSSSHVRRPGSWLSPPRSAPLASCLRSESAPCWAARDRGIDALCVCSGSSSDQPAMSPSLGPLVILAASSVSLRSHALYVPLNWLHQRKHEK